MVVGGFGTLLYRGVRMGDVRVQLQPVRAWRVGAGETTIRGPVFAKNGPGNDGAWRSRDWTISLGFLELRVTRSGYTRWYEAVPVK